jgi:hypothetical protein
MPVREKDQDEPGCEQLLPSHVPSNAQTAAKVRGFSPTAPRYTSETDWLLEETGFEPSVPPDRCSTSIRLTPSDAGSSEQNRGIEFATDSPLEGAGFEPSVPLKAPDVLVVSVLVRARRGSSGGDMSRSSNLGRLTRYRWFESAFLQRRVRLSRE